ncbi:nucleoside-diphosphate kinase [bacterium]|nr:nucleoside-diphosphate kinase [bacterium]
MVKPDGVQRQLVGEIISRFEKKGLKLAGLKITQISKEKAETHYGEHKERPFFGELVDFITSGPVIAMVWEGENAIALSRVLMGATKAEDAAPGTIRGDYALYTGKNLVHGSDSTESAKREIGIFFDESELVSYDLDASAWIV